MIIATIERRRPARRANSALNAIVEMMESNGNISTSAQARRKTYSGYVDRLRKINPTAIESNIDKTPQSKPSPPCLTASDIKNTVSTKHSRSATTIIATVHHHLVFNSTICESSECIPKRESRCCKRDVKEVIKTILWDGYRERYWAFGLRIHEILPFWVIIFAY
ncbi:hypothetical protein OZX62_06755 [Bifidobacterium sp. ESL0690]|uniref:hypothetical protein n=1 Tax=Bifidobacterium sp. ESL0690 TaxID=2983214 RepID=UPI0023F7A099|nr:hypothetical protein [Bifidobacterium sp. ESL0690]WEV46152.1 hypothetical protein OZX62_06755 [Bifidobacterium sp. ESL0690]